MRQAVIVQFTPDDALEITPPGGTELSAEAARVWLDQQFIANDCEPLRASGKVITADKLLSLAQALGRQGFEADPAFAEAYASAALAAMARPSVRVDLVEGRVVS